MKTIKLTQGKETIVDDEDYEELSKYKWYYANGYAVRNQKNESGKYGMIYLHRIVAQTELEKQTDHINADPLDNRRANLRNVTIAQNSRNRKRNKISKSGYKGVLYRKDRNKWRAMIGFNGRKINLGQFNTPEEAHEAYCIASTLYHKEYGRTE